MATRPRPLDTKVALVTGASRGIGRAVALHLADLGATIAVNYRRDQASASETVEQIRASGGEGLAYQAPVEDSEAIGAMVQAITGEFGGLDIVVHNAGVASRGHSVADTDLDELRRIVDVHAFAAFRLSQLVLPWMRSRGGGSMVMISSVATTLLQAGSAPYSMAKLALEGLAGVLAKEEADHGINVNVVAPGLVATEMGDRLTRSIGIGHIGELDRLVPLGHVVSPAEVAQVVGFLVGPDAAMVTGQRLVIDGGGIRSTDQRPSASDA